MSNASASAHGRRRLALPVACGLLAAALLAYGLTVRARSNAAPAPPLPGAVLRGPRTTLRALRGQPAIVAFFASWCGPCHSEAPALERFSDSAAGRHRIVAVDYGDERGAALAFVKRYAWTFPVLSDPSTAAGDAWGVARLPAIVVLDAAGRIVAQEYGPQTVTRLRAALRAAS